MAGPVYNAGVDSTVYRRRWPGGANLSRRRLRASGLKLLLVVYAVGRWQRRRKSDLAHPRHQPRQLPHLDACGVRSGSIPTPSPGRAMRIRGDSAVSRLTFSASDAGFPSWVHRREQSVAKGASLRPWRARITSRYSAPPGLEPGVGAEAVAPELDNGESLSARLLVGADGTRSWCGRRRLSSRSRRTMASSEWSPIFRREASGNVARQWFRQDGIPALLPLPGERVSMVWSAWEADGRALLAASPEALCERVKEASHGNWAGFSSSRPRRRSPCGC